MGYELMKAAVLKSQLSAQRSRRDAMHKSANTAFVVMKDASKSKQSTSPGTTTSKAYTKDGNGWTYASNIHKLTVYNNNSKDPIRVGRGR